MSVPKPHWKQPWDNVVPVPIEELAECYSALGEQCRDHNGTLFVWTKETVLAHWRGREMSPILDAYILPERSSGWHSIGVRYGDEPHEYLSPMGDKDKVEALLRKYKP